MEAKERQEQEKYLIKLLKQLGETEEEATLKAASLSDEQLYAEITEAGMCVGWE